MKVFMMTTIILIGCSFLYSQNNNKGKDFINEANWIYSVLACGTNTSAAPVNQKAVKHYCSYIKKRYQIYRRQFLNNIGPFMKKHSPHDVSNKIIYPFGGNDLFAAMAVFPNAKEITTISLEHSGDPRKIIQATPYQIRKALHQFQKIHGNILTFRDNSNANVLALEKGLIPGQLALSIAAARLFNYRPVALSFFKINPDGTLYYYTQNDIQKLAKTRTKRLHRYWKDPGFSIVFKNMEIIYKKTNHNQDHAYLVHRHIAANLHDNHFNKSPLKAHLIRKGKITVITKGASYLLWRNDFSHIRNYLLENMLFMISDATGILPVHAAKAGFKQLTFGKFHGAFLAKKGGTQAHSLKKLFKSQPYRPLTFRFGHADIYGAYHLIITIPRK